MRRLVAVALIALSGCGIGSEKKIEDGRVHELVLQPSDVGTGFRRTYRRAAGAVAQVRYRPVEPRSAAALAIESNAHVFRSSKAAEESLDADRSTLARRSNWQPIGEPGLGDESFAATVAAAATRSYAVFWRAGNATASLRVVGLQERAPLADVLELARTQDRRIADAAG